MHLKSLRSNQVSHNVYRINKIKQLNQGESQYDYFVVTNSIQTTNGTQYSRQLTTIARFMCQNYTIKDEVNGFIQTTDGSKFPTTMFSSNINAGAIQSSRIRNKGKLSLIKDNVWGITYFKNILTQERVYLYSIDENSGYELQLNGDIIMSSNMPIGVFVPHINCILWLDNESDINYMDSVSGYGLSYFFNIHQFQYLCITQANELNMTNNRSAYDVDGGLRWKDDLYITGIGLFDDDNQLLAIAKLSQPVRKSSIIPTTFIIQFDYIP